MTEKDRPAALIPARGGSKRFPRKNVALFKGRPLITHAIAAALESGVFSKVVVSTEDAEIAEISREAGAAVTGRRAELALDAATVTQVALDYLETWRKAKVEPESLCVIYPTAALLKSEDLTEARKVFEERRANALMSTTRYWDPPQWALRESKGALKPVFPKALVQTQKLEPWCVDAGYFYFIRSAALRKYRTFYTPKLAGYPLPRLRVVDINEPEDLRLAEALASLEEKAPA